MEVATPLPSGRSSTKHSRTASGTPAWLTSPLGLGRGKGSKPKERPSSPPINPFDSDPVEVVRAASQAAFDAEIQTKGKPRTVFVQLKLFDLSSISDADNTATLDLGVFLRWHDTSLVGTQTTFGRTASEYEALWSPLLEVNNGEGMEEVWDADTSWNLKSYETGEVKYAQRYRGAVKLSSRRDLRAFPFDSESVKVYLGPKFLKSSKVVFVVEPSSSGGFAPPSEGCSLPGFSLSSSSCALRLVTGASGHSNVVLYLPVSRLWQPYARKILMVNFLLVAFSWTAFLAPPADLLDRVNVTITLALASVTFLYVVDDSLPKVSYLTVIDKILLGSFIVLAATALESSVAFALAQGSPVTLSYLGVTPNPPLSAFLDAVSLIGFPAAFVLMHVVMVGRGLRDGRRRREIPPREEKGKVAEQQSPASRDMGPLLKKRV